MSRRGWGSPGHGSVTAARYEGRSSPGASSNSMRKPNQRLTKSRADNRDVREAAVDAARILQVRNRDSMVTVTDLRDRADVPFHRTA